MNVPPNIAPTCAIEFPALSRLRILTSLTVERGRMLSVQPRLPYANRRPLNDRALLKFCHRAGHGHGHLPHGCRGINASEQLTNSTPRLLNVSSAVAKGTPIWRSGQTSRPQRHRRRRPTRKVDMRPLLGPRFYFNSQSRLEDPNRLAILSLSTVFVAGGVTIWAS